MFSRGEYCDGKNTYGMIMNHSKQFAEVILTQNGAVSSAYKKDGIDEYSFLTSKAKEAFKVIQTGIGGCKAKNGVSMPFSLGSSMAHSFIKTKVEYNIEIFSNSVVRALITWGDSCKIELEYETNENLIPQGIPYVRLTVSRKIEDDSEGSEDSLNDIPVRTVAEIAMEKEDVSWLKNKQYYIVNDDEQAEKIFSILDNWKGPIAYDTETTGLRINCFGKINSSYQRDVLKYNAEHPEAPLRVDRLVGIIFCVEENISYYFPCFNRKFKNLYESDTETRRKIINNIKVRYTIGEFRDKQSDMADYIRNTPSEEWGCDVILMERVRNILSKLHIVAHNGAFEWKVGWQYEIDTNLKDDTMIMHQIMYKFRTTTSNRGEPSNLKYLAKVELGIDQWELGDFFPDFKEDNSGLVKAAGAVAKKKKKKGSKIDFSYMDYEGTRVYAPTDGDVTLLLFKKYKTDMIKNHKEQEYIYNVEVIVSCAIAYMEFYGHRIDEAKILGVRDQTKAEIACIESEIRQEVQFAREDEIQVYQELKAAMQRFKEAEKAEDMVAREQANTETLSLVDKLYATIAANEEHQLNLGSPSQVAELFYDVLGYPMQGDKKSVAAKPIKPLLKAKNEDGSPTYPVAVMYAEYKKKDTLMTKFFDNLPSYMYCGGLVFSSFGQISTATGRMSCSKPNAQQYPKAITGIVVPRPGYVHVDADYSQIEYRVLTALAGNDWLAKLFADPDSDYHTLMASLMYGVPYASVTPKMRGDAKSFNFGIPYGMGFKSLAILLTGNSKPSSVDEAKEKYEKYFENQPKTRAFFDNVKEMAQVNKYTKTHWGRYRYYSFTDADGNENNARKAAALRQAGNAIIQGCLDGDTRIQTKELGITKIKDALGVDMHVWDGDKWSRGDILYSGKKQKCIVTFSNGQKIVCSPIHKFSVVNYDSDITDICGNRKFVECKNLKPGIEIECNTKSDLTILGTSATRYLKRVNNREESIELVIKVESVEITDEYIDMYDVCNTDGGYYVADGVVTHNTAADVFKISVARNFMYIRENQLFGDFIIINMVHDEQLFELNAEKLNVKKVLADIGRNMQFDVEGFPPLLVGAGVGPAWGKAKGKMAEIHPNLLEQMTQESMNDSIWNTGEMQTPEEVYDYFNERVYEFRRQKVYDYLVNPENFNKDLHPAIGNLLNLQFTYGHDKDKEGLKDDEFTLLCVDEFIKNNNIAGVDSSMFVAKTESMEDAEEDDEYTDGEDEDFDEDVDIGDHIFTLIDESNVIYGTTIQDLIREFKFFVSPIHRICGINSLGMRYTKKDELVDYLYRHMCEEDDPDGMEIVFLQEGNILNRTGVFVKGINPDVLEESMVSI